MQSFLRLAGIFFALLIVSNHQALCAELTILPDGQFAANDFSLTDARVSVDPQAAAVVHQAADLLIDDIHQVTGQVRSELSPSASATAILIGTIGDGGLVDQLAASRKVDIAGVRDQTETFAWQLVDHPTPECQRALVIIGSDQRGTAYGCTELSRAIGVSPWNWWADVPATHHDHLVITPGRRVDGPPGVKYRGIFINDEDWGMRPWASKTFDPGTGNFGPKTYGKLFELMLRLRLNYLWPAMHPGSAEFGSVPGNVEMADHWGVVMGSSHCEPMLRNNVYWPEKNGPWRYDVNRDNILRYWTESADQRGKDEAVWTLGIRGIHDSPMQGPKDVPSRVKMVDGVIADQRDLINKKVSSQFGKPVECFIPYKEVLTLYDAGLKVPDDVTLVWPDDNFGYIRHLPTAAERQRSGGSGIYFHVSYWGSPHSYLWVETISPGLIWEELHKAWENDAGRIWMLNVGDLKPAEIATDFYAQLAWAPDRWGADAQNVFLKQFVGENFGQSAIGPVCELLTAYYKLAAMRKPEHFTVHKEATGTPEPLDDLSDAQLAEQAGRYQSLLLLENTAAAVVPNDRADAYFETVGYAARALGLTGQLYAGLVTAARHGEVAAQPTPMDFKRQIDADAARYNDEIAGGKWRLMMSLTPEGMTWPKEVGGKYTPRYTSAAPATAPRAVTIDAADGLPAQMPSGHAWQAISGLGWSGRAVTVLPATDGGKNEPMLEFPFFLRRPADASSIHLCFLPTMRIDPAGTLRVSVQVDDGPSTIMDVPGGETNEVLTGPRHVGVIIGRVMAALPASPLLAGPHRLRVTAINAGVVLDQIELPASAVVSGGND